MIDIHLKDVKNEIMKLVLVKEPMQKVYIKTFSEMEMPERLMKRK